MTVANLGLPVKHATLLTLDRVAADRVVTAHWSGGPTLRFWMPESFTDDASGRILWIGDDPWWSSVKVEQNSSGKIAITGAVPDLFNHESEIELLEKAEGLSIRMRIRNCSPFAWQNAHLAACVQLAEATGFADTTLERTYALVGGKLCSLGRELGFACGHLAYLVRGRTRPAAWKGKDTDKQSPPNRVDAGWIGVADHSGRSVIATMWEQALAVAYNTVPSYACIHSNPFIGDVPAGGEMLTCGVVLLTRGSVEEAYRAASAEIERIG